MMSSSSMKASTTSTSANLSIVEETDEAVEEAPVTQKTVAGDGEEGAKVGGDLAEKENQGPGHGDDAKVNLEKGDEAQKENMAQSEDLILQEVKKDGKSNPKIVAFRPRTAGGMSQRRGETQGSVFKGVSSFSSQIANRLVQLSPASGLRSLSLTSPGGVKRPLGAGEDPIQCILHKKQKTLPDDATPKTPTTSTSSPTTVQVGKIENSICSAFSPAFVAELTTAPLSCSTPPSRSAINQLVHESFSSSFLPPHPSGQPGQRRALSFQSNPLPSFLFSSEARTGKKLTRAQSDSAMTIKTAVERINNDTNLLGDGSKLYILPVLMDGKHADLKEISPNTLVSLMEGKYHADVQNYEIIDCRYPYEFDGGHIVGAVNLHTKRQVYERFLGSKDVCTAVREGKRHVVVFHCEFSSQRGPDMCRYIRTCDRRMNDYPFLHYPELYVLFGGYKAFFEQHKAYCVPQEYLTMVDEKYVEQFRFYKSLSKTDDSTAKKKSFTRSDGKIMQSTSMKKLCLEHL